MISMNMRLNKLKYIISISGDSNMVILYTLWPTNGMYHSSNNNSIQTHSVLFDPLMSLKFIAPFFFY